MDDVAALRAHLKWSQSQMAECLGCSQPTVFHIEGGGRPPNRSVRRLLDRLSALVEQGRALPGMAVADVVALMVDRLPSSPSSALQPLPQGA